MLYKYLRPDRISVLENFQIRFSQPRALNDPFESLALVRADVEVDTLFQQYMVELDELFDELDPSEKTAEAIALVNEAKAAVRANVHETLSPQNIGAQLMELINTKIGVLSLSKSYKNLLMWAHYGDSHKGLVIGFDETDDFFHAKDWSGQRTDPHDVIYSSVRHHASKDDPDIYRLLLCHKSLDWAYEEEVRIFRSFVNVSPKGVDQLGLPVYLFRLPRQCIKEIYIGANASASLEEKILSCVSKGRLEAKVFKATQSKSRYELEFLDVPATYCHYTDPDVYGTIEYKMPTRLPID